ncbi:MAG: cell envelope-related transcriptional attenuator [Nocardioides sp.]|jgi:LCP family protein required for cell wall assembly|nr:cell envelope-related transcriptional attenuator [Nocardioides sp.]
MTDRPRGDGEPEDGSPDFHWLYGGGARPDGAEPRPDETRVMPTQPRPSGTPVPPPTTAPGRSSTPPVPPRPAPTPGPTAPPPRRRRGFRFWLRIVLVLLLLWVVYLVAVPVWAWTKVDKIDYEPSGKRPDDQPGHTYLMVGSDSRAGLSKEQRKELATGNAAGQRTDTIMLLHTGDGPNLLMSIPRDSLVEIPGHGTSKINAAYAYGYAGKGGADGGAQLLVKTVELNTGIKIDDYVEIGLGGVVDIVDAVGGIQICPTENMTDKLAGLDIEKGCQEADGRTALAFARSRHTSNLGDLDRAKHQREVVSAVGKEVVSPWTFLNPFRYWGVVMAMPDSFAFGEGMKPWGGAMWASAMTHVNGDNGLTCGVPISDLAVHWDPQRSKQMFGYIKDDKTDDIPKSLCTPSGLPRSVTGG